MSLPENIDLSDLGCGCSAHCRLCGCGDFHACTPPCSWVVDPLDLGPLCSACLPKVEAAIEQLQADLAELERHELIERHVDADQTLWAPTAKGLALKLDPGLKTRDELLRAQHVVRASDLLPPDWIATASARYESEHGREP
jgi:hypothetical protein